MAELFRLGLVLALLVVLLRKKVDMGIVMMLASLAMALLFRMRLADVLGAVLAGTFSPGTLDLVIALILIALLEHILRANRLLNGMMRALKALAGDSRVVMALLPAIVGLLPSAGGALFSAPLVEEVGGGQVEPERKTFINYWYRHVWEYTFPLYPGLMLAAEILRVPIARLMLSQLPLTIAAVILGIPVSFRGLKNSLQRAPGKAKDEGGALATRPAPAILRQMAIGLFPILAVVTLVLATGLNVSLAVGLVVIAMLAAFRYSPGRAWSALREATSWGMVAMVLGVMVFKETLAASGVVQLLPGSLQELGVSLEVLVVSLSFLIGLLTGFSPGFIGATFPLIAAAGVGTARGPDLGLVRLAYAAGFAGVMLSPVHLCLVVTLRYFRSEPARLYRLLYLPETGMVLVALGAYILGHRR